MTFGITNPFFPCCRKKKLETFFVSQLKRQTANEPLPCAVFLLMWTPLWKASVLSKLKKWIAAVAAKKNHAARECYMLNESPVAPFWGNLPWHSEELLQAWHFVLSTKVVKLTTPTQNNLLDHKNAGCETSNITSSTATHSLTKKYFQHKVVLNDNFFSFFLSMVKTNPRCRVSHTPFFRYDENRGESVMRLFLKINLSTTTLMKRSRRELSIDMIIHSCILKITNSRYSSVLPSQLTQGWVLLCWTMFSMFHACFRIIEAASQRLPWTNLIQSRVMKSLHNLCQPFLA